MSALAENDEQKQLRETVRKLLSDKAPLEALRQEPPPGLDRALWRTLAEVGVVALAVPEKHGGLGQTALETSVVLEEMGRALYSGPYLSTVALAVPALLASGDEAACAELLPDIAEGECIATLSLDEHSVTADADCSRLTGELSIVLDGADADLILVAAASGQDVSLFAVNADAEGLTREPLESLDLARSVAKVSFSDTPARLIGTPGAAPAVLAGVRDHALTALAAEQTGGAAACLALCVEYAKTREQFGQPIGAFQAVAHKCVEMLHGVEFSRGAARYASAALAEGAADAAEAARVAAAQCGEAFRQIVVETVQVHGGVGFTWEHDTHLYYRRAWSSGQLFGGVDEHYLAVADLALSD
ncbi:MAG TPA: acyl-CoA dehydrogenase family protein [Pseudonocardia sp.]|jgi:alkylation response protein AidB-like acyl-CoA dehydrogenase|nr:acyl-CoA dehydrogenase family protein [Pseudonocardia sp.]